MKNKQGFAPIVIILVVAALVVGGGGYWYYLQPKLPAISNDLAQEIKVCDEEQARINTPTLPRCLLKTFKDAGWEKGEVIVYVKKKLDINILDQNISDFWKDALREYYLEESSVSDSTSTIQGASNISGWKTYHNEKYAFEIKYPGNMVFSTIDFTDPEDVKEKNFAFSDNNPALFRMGLGFLGHKQSSSHSYTFSIEKVAKGITIDAWFREFEEALSNSTTCKIDSVKDTRVAGIPAKSWQAENGCRSVDRGITFVRGESVYMFIYNGWLDVDESNFVNSLFGERPTPETITAAFDQINKYREPFRIIFDQVFSTFKFTK